MGIWESGSMALRNPVYLDMESLLAQAEYNDIEVPVASDIVERTVNQREGSAKLSYGILGAGGSKGSEVEYQSSYKLDPRPKATVSKIIDALIRDEVVRPLNNSLPVSQDDLVEISGTIRITAASLAGKLFHLLQNYMASIEQSVTDFDIEEAEPELLQRFQQIYLGNELLPIPLLAEVEGIDHECLIFVNLQPNFFINRATVDQVEGERRILGSVRNMVEAGEDGYLSSEEWLLYGWEITLKRLLMTKISDQLSALTEALQLELKPDDVQAWIKGPAIIIDAIAMY